MSVITEQPSISIFKGKIERVHMAIGAATAQHKQHNPSTVVTQK